MQNKWISLCVILISVQLSQTKQIRFQDVSKMVESWSETLGKKLWDASEAFTRRNEALGSFKETRVRFEEAPNIHQRISDKLERFLQKKYEAVDRIQTVARTVASNRRVSFDGFSSYSFYNADNLDVGEAQAGYLSSSRDECEEDAPMTKRHRRHKNKRTRSNMRKCRDNHPHYKATPEHYLTLPMRYNSHFGTNVDTNISVIRMSPSVNPEDRDLKIDVQWSNALDHTFMKNYKRDPTLTWQYFASPKGFLRLYPAIKWPHGPYEKVYEFRTRQWYTDILSSPKDVVILLDKSASMKGIRRNMSRLVVNTILDTLHENDFVNVLVFDNDTRPLVECFGEGLVQANEENVRAFRENLLGYKTEWAANLTRGLYKAFRVHSSSGSWRSASAHCNQVIMIVTDGVDYDYDPEVFRRNNRGDTARKTRIFTYHIGKGSDGKHLKAIACQNRGYFVNISNASEAREKVFNYLTVMSRPMNKAASGKVIWSGLYVDLADRKMSNWLWANYQKKVQSDVYVTYNAGGHVTVAHLPSDEVHDYDIYRPYNYMVTVSAAVFDLQASTHHQDILGVAAIDIPLDLIKSQIAQYQIGVNGYAFIVTNNGYLILHPDHRKESNRILRPTFNRVDMLEVEIMEGQSKPREFDRSATQLRQNIVQQNVGNDHLSVITPIDDMKRVILERRHYYYGPLGNYSLVVALPEKYGMHKVEHLGLDGLAREVTPKDFILRNWTVHPEWFYCKKYTKRMDNEPTEHDILFFLPNITGFPLNRVTETDCDVTLVKTLLADIKVTEWFDRSVLQHPKASLFRNMTIALTFMATHSGLTRWQNVQNNLSSDDEKHFSKRHNKGTDEVWYRRAADINFYEDSFIYSIPFNANELENETLVTASNVIYSRFGTNKAPVAAIGYQFYQRSLSDLFVGVTKDVCVNHNCGRCDGDFACYVLDNNGYIMVSDGDRHLGEFFGEHRPDIMNLLVGDNMYRSVRFFDYQGLCLVDRITESFGLRHLSFLNNLSFVFNWIVGTIFYLMQSVWAVTDYHDEVYRQTEEFEKLEVKKRVPTPCDQERYLYTFPNHDKSNLYNVPSFSKRNNEWLYVAKRVPKSNLVVLVVNALIVNNSTAEKFTPSPETIDYNETLACYISRKNNYTNRKYIPCHYFTQQEQYLPAQQRCGDY